jgi:tetratricopeptide (TPR) repeat protein
MNRASELQTNRLYDSALVEFQEARRLDSTVAEFEYALASILDTLGRYDDASRFYARARDLDMLRFRASSDFNEVILRQADDSSVFVIDMERVFAENSPHGLIGRSLILEHLHPVLFGYFLMGRAYAVGLARAGIPVEAASWPDPDSLREQELWARRPPTELDERLARRRVELLTSGWPFRTEGAGVSPPTPSDTLGVLSEAVLSGEISWEEACVRAAEMYSRSGDVENARRMYRGIINQIPVNVSPYLRLGSLLNDAGRTGEADSIFRQSLNVERTAIACRALGVIGMNKGDPRGAVPLLVDAVNLSPTNEERASSGYLLALALTRTGNDQAAIERLEWVLRIAPGHGPSRSLHTFLIRKAIK